MMVTEIFTLKPSTSYSITTQNPCSARAVAAKNNPTAAAVYPVKVILKTAGLTVFRIERRCFAVFGK